MKQLLLGAGMTFPILMAAHTAAGQGFDLIQPFQGSGVRGEITGSTSTEIIISFNGVDRQVAVNEVKQVSFRGAPTELNGARRDTSGGNYQSALAKLLRINRDDISRAIVKQEVDFQIALATSRTALAGGADKNKAVSLMQSFVKENKESFHFYEALEELGNLAASLQIYDKAVDYYGQLAEAPWKEYRVKADVLEAGAMLMQKKYDTALQKFETAARSEATGAQAERLKTMARLGKATCLAETGKPEDGIILTTEILYKANPEDTLLHARAYNARGACFRKSKKTQDALLAYLHIDILYPIHAEAHAEALYYLTGLWEQIGKRDRAAQTRELLRTRYPDTGWAKQL